MPALASPTRDTLLISQLRDNAPRRLDACPYATDAKSAIIALRLADILTADDAYLSRARSRGHRGSQCRRWATSITALVFAAEEEALEPVRRRLS